eukprot:gene27955-1656_t
MEQLPPFDANMRGFDANSVGGWWSGGAADGDAARCIQRAVRRWRSMGEAARRRRAVPKAGVSSHQMICNASRHDDLDAIHALVAKGAVVPVVQHTFLIDAFADAFHAAQQHG